MTLVVGLAVFVAAVLPVLVDSPPPPQAVNALAHTRVDIFAIIFDLVCGDFFTS